MIEDQLLIIKWRKILMNWPKKTLSNRKIVAYNKIEKEFELLVQLSDRQRVDELIKKCTEKIMSFDTPVVRREAAMRFQLIEKAHGRCQACGISSSKCPLDIDHIVPREEAERKRGIWHGKVPNGRGTLIDIDDIENLQVLCEKCNRGKRDQGKFYDFRPSKISLIESGSALVEAVMNATKGDLEERTEILRKVKQLLETALR
jgi:5-methylcytosine-specific restriction endonuclease McrA